jgi:hypothetical protein
VAPTVQLVALSVSIGTAPSCTATIKATVQLEGGPMTVDLAYNINGGGGATDVTFSGMGVQTKQIVVGTADGSHDGSADVHVRSTGAGKSTSWRAPARCAVVFRGSAANPVITVNGEDFGAEPAGELWNTTSCGSYTDNGRNYGERLWFVARGEFAAGNGACVGIKVMSWSRNRVVFQFGNSYNTFQGWRVEDGDPCRVMVAGQTFTGTASYS